MGKIIFFLLLVTLGMRFILVNRKVDSVVGNNSSTLFLPGHFERDPSWQEYEAFCRAKGYDDAVVGLNHFGVSEHNVVSCGYYVETSTIKI